MYVVIIKQFTPPLLLLIMLWCLKSQDIHIQHIIPKRYHPLQIFSRAPQKAYKTICNILKFKVSYQNYLVHTTVQTNATWQLLQTTHPINSYSLTFHAHFLLQSQLRQLQFLAHIFILHWTDYSNQTVHWWLWAGCLVIQVLVQNSGCHAKLSRCGDVPRICWDLP